jgi:hypothetical protein
MTKQECEEAVKGGKRVVTPINALGYWHFYIDPIFDIGLCAYHNSKSEMCNGTWQAVHDDDKLLADAFVYEK